MSGFFIVNIHLPTHTHTHTRLASNGGLVQLCASKKKNKRKYGLRETCSILLQVFCFDAMRCGARQATGGSFNDSAVARHLLSSYNLRFILM